MIKIAFLNQKGGVGKTTTAVNIAAVIGKELNKRVLVVDCDCQRNATQYLLSAEEENEEEYTITDYLDDIPTLTLVKHVKMENRGKLEDTNICVIPADSDMSEFRLPDIHIISKMLDEVDSRFDYCIIDMPPQFSGLSSISANEGDYSIALSALVACDYVVVPANASRFSISGYDDLLESINLIRNKGWNVNLKMLGMVLNNVNYQRGTQKYITDLNMQNNQDTFKHCIKSASVIEQAEYFGKPVCYYAKRSPSAIEYIALAKEMIKRINQSKKEK